MNFERTHAYDGIHEICYFNEYRPRKWQSREELREWLKNAVGTIAASALIIGGFVAACIVEAL